MVPAAAVDAALEQLTPLLEPDDIIFDGGNSHYHDDLRRAAALPASHIAHVDVGTSGGVAGLDRGYCLMVGGQEESVQHLAPGFATPATAEPVRRRDGARGCQLPALSPVVAMTIALAARVKRAGKEFVGDQREFPLLEEEPAEQPPCERLLTDAMEGDGALLAREDAIEAAWAVVEPVPLNFLPWVVPDDSNFGAWVFFRSQATSSISTGAR